MAKVTVVIPTYNRSLYVTKAVESVLNQDYTDWEILVVDDGSTDDTKCVLRAFDGKIRYIYQPNSGVSSARNTGIGAAKGEWIAFLDSDDEWLPNYLARQMERLETRSSSVCMQITDCHYIESGSTAISYFEFNGALSRFGSKEYLHIEKPFRFIITHAPWQVGATIFARDAIRRAGLFDPMFSISEDLDLMARVALQGNLGLIRQGLVNIYRRNETGECLTQRAMDHPLQARESSDGIYKKLAKTLNLGFGERKALRRVMSANKRAMGNLLMAKGEKSMAQACFKQALLTDPCLRSLGRYCQSYLPSRRELSPLGSPEGDNVADS